jgi:hypothetical protein
VTGQRGGEEELGGPPPGDVGRPAAGESEPHDDPTSAALAREVYWAGDGGSRRPADVGSLRERLDAFTHQMRIEQRQPVPIGDAFLESASGWRRRTKLFVWRLTRFSTMRYDRLLGDLAEMNGDLARRLLETEEEVTRLREELDRRGGESS